MKKIIGFLNRIEGDKWAHLLVCLLITTTLGFWSILTFHVTSGCAALVGGVIALILGVLKEVRDGFFVPNNVFSGADLLADIIGAVIGFILVSILG